MVKSDLVVSRSRIAIKVFLKHLLAPVGLLLRQPPGLRVLFYHRVNRHSFSELGLVSRELTVPTDDFEKQMAYLARRGYRTIGLEEARRMIGSEIPLDPKAVLITFDDGYLDNLTDAAPILQKYGATAVVFPVLDMIGTDNRAWPLADKKGLGDFMDESHLHTWLSQGLEIGSHTCTHPILTDLDDAALARELRRSREGFDALLPTPCTAIAYPGGNVDRRVRAATSKAGYGLAFTTRSGRTAPGGDPVDLCRTEVSASDTHLIFKLKLAGIFDWLGVRDTPGYRRIMRLGHRALATLAGAHRMEQK